MSERAFRVEIENLKAKNKLFESELEECRNILNRKDKETNILVSRMK